MTTHLKPEQIAEKFAALKKGRVAEYVGGGRLHVWNRRMTGTLCGYYVTTREALAAVERKQARA